MATTTYVTQQGDTWDVISKRLFDGEHFMDELIKANIEHRKVVIFPYGVRLTVPEIDDTSKDSNANLPPWKRAEGV